uniref:TNFR-Cys domain-containing protein n=1 Tax=Chromera velia CCMP2878 TaxID=1169474 RepID=A0A0G4HVZ9_9ALVE|eukprot:Cvel_8938.t1-p1 / transcript=Cvel_8938.t1 / gene=Cvel_8938 / organism=Chromera_velia_CCMP2878 / gene_product=hypothetical protein / transcript_product=hypothetical protein / location=Cvel_scaffold503:53534-54626(+) / protein_length=150 / sequence_SO=supercontig / SO=protein_coding / is_pseudo=false
MRTMLLTGFLSMYSMALVTFGDQGGACINESDLEALKSASFGPAISTCGSRHVGAKEGTKRCLLDNTYDGKSVSEACADCFASAVSCGAVNCWSSCMWGNCRDACRKCSTSSCGADLYSCSGLDFDTAPDPCDPSKKPRAASEASEAVVA